MKTLFFILKCLGFKKTNLIFKSSIYYPNFSNFSYFFKNNEFHEKEIYAINMNDIVIFSLFNKISFSFPVTITFIYSSFYNPPEIYGGFRSQLPKHYKYSQNLIINYENYKPLNIQYKNEYKNIIYIN